MTGDNTAYASGPDGEPLPTRMRNRLVSEVTPTGWWGKKFYDEIK